MISGVFIIAKIPITFTRKRYCDSTFNAQFDVFSTVDT